MHSLYAYFFKLTNHRQGDDSFDVCLSNLHNLFISNNGQYITTGGLRLRLENLTRQLKHCTGDFIRQQNEDIHPFANDGLPLQPNQTPLGHRCAFLYHYDSQTLILQQNRGSGINCNAIASLIATQLNHGGFNQVSLICQDTIEDLAKGGVRKFTVKFAQPTDLSIVQTGSVLQSLQNMKQMFASPTIEITCGFSTPEKGSLDVKQVVNFIRSLYTSNANLTKLQIKQEGSAELLDLLGKKLRYTDDVDLDSNDIQRHFIHRRLFLEAALNQHENYITTYYSG